jgi:hypothetical protein
MTLPLQRPGFLQQGHQLSFLVQLFDPVRKTTHGLAPDENVGHLCEEGKEREKRRI